ncbi:MAG: hypothetical protein NUV69_04465 [Candidatus Curtissbacteria bacterium]|nr:hypothetical protein [Candidatus Curtissbacteria bacterium]
MAAKVKPRRRTAKKRESQVIHSVPRNRKSIGSVILVFLIVVAALAFAQKNLGTKDSGNEQVSKSSPSAEIEKLKEVYEAEKGISMKNVVPRYSVFQDDTLGFKIAYPVGFVATTTGSGVKLVPSSGKGHIILTVSGGQASYDVNTSGLSTKEAGVLGVASDFVKSTYQAVGPANTSGLPQRFSQGNEDLQKY